MLTASHVPHERLRETPEGLEKHCAKCSEWWPADREFFFGDPEGVHRLFYCCKACYREHLDPRRLDKVDRSQHAPLPSLFGARA
jgi:hypothetical protein